VQLLASPSSVVQVSRLGHVIAKQPFEISAFCSVPQALPGLQYQWVSANAIVVITLKAAIISRAFLFFIFNSFMLLVYFCGFIVSLMFLI